MSETADKEQMLRDAQQEIALLCVLLAKARERESILAGVCKRAAEAFSRPEETHAFPRFKALAELKEVAL